MTWNDEKTLQAQRLWRDGVSASVIAKRIGGVSRNAVIGRMYRTLGPKDAEGAKRARSIAGKLKVAADKARKQPKPKIDRRAPAQFNARRPTRDELAASAAEWQQIKADIERQDAARTNLIALLDLEPHHCRWPIGDPTRGYCGHAKVPGSSYCAGHLARAVTNIDLLTRLGDRVPAIGRDASVREDESEPVAA